ncbi:CvpA family protein [Erythrobacteraceae bacterium CFH 75059]|uniref:CvpA family protein n=1 Tax=Qipengyuania thermophila TaxID=2509361 RepID=UPI00101F292E|nr:CvpA family protein [Qipengyuania thermophila]TCD05189.1 CvpA family protein [Erythrobacteraceae bacterium CFH 75059]
MTGFDYIVLLVVGVAAIGGFMRGFVQEVLSLLAWVAGIMAIRLFHTALAQWLAERIGEGTSTEVLAFVLLLLVPYALIQLLARRVGSASRRSVLGPVDRALGFGFGMVKGVVVVIVGFSMLVLAYDTIWGVGGRPAWMVQARTYSFIDAGSRAFVEMIAERRDEYLQGQQDQPATTDAA